MIDALWRYSTHKTVTNASSQVCGRRLAQLMDRVKRRFYQCSQIWPWMKLADVFIFRTLHTMSFVALPFRLTSLYPRLNLSLHSLWKTHGSFSIFQSRNPQTILHGISHWSLFRSV